MSAPPTADALLGDPGSRTPATPGGPTGDAILDRIMWQRMFGRDPAPDQPDIWRDRYRRPKVVPPGHKYSIYYSSPSTVAKTHSDTYKLHEYDLRNVIKGLVARPDLYELAAAHFDDRDKLDQIAADAQGVAKADEKSNRGTAIHKVVQKAVHGVDLGMLTPSMRRDLDAYLAYTRGFEHVLSECFCVHDGQKLAGSFDHVIGYRGKYFIGDVKSGGAEYGQHEWAVQLGIYSRSTLYDWKTAQHVEANDKPAAVRDADLRRSYRDVLGADIDLERGIVIHLPIGTGTAQTYWIDLTRGWDGAERAMFARRFRTQSSRETLAVAFEPERPATVIDLGATRAPGAPPRRLTRVELPDPPPPADPRPGRDGAAVLAAAPKPDPTDLLDPDAEVFRQLAAATTEDALKAVWRRYRATFTTAMKDRYVARRAEIRERA